MNCKSYSIVRGASAVLAAGFLASCAAVQVRVLPEAPGEAAQVAGVLRSAKPEPAAGMLVAASEDGIPVEVRIERLVGAARLAWPGAMDGDANAGLIYRAALRELTEVVLEMGDTGGRPVLLPGSGGRLVIEKSGHRMINPFEADRLTAADQIRVGGLSPRVTVDGIGLPSVAWYRSDSPLLKGQPGIPPVGQTVPVTAVLTFDGRGERGTARLKWINTLLQETVTSGGQSRQLAADYTAPLAYLISRGRNRAIDLRSMILTDVYLSEAGLFQYQVYEPGKIPVVFVHGLMSRPEAWTNAVNGLMADKEIRSRYQFWFFRYPTGLPVWASAALLRKELDRFDAALLPRTPRGADRKVLESKVLIGHSMGGIVSNLLIRDGGDNLWRQFSDVPIDNVRLRPEPMQLLNDFIRFDARDDISRVVFVATPHQGSLIAARPISRIGASLIRLPFPDLSPTRAGILDFLRDDARILFRAPANSIRFLRPRSPLLLSILQLPKDESIPLHSIIGDRGRGDTPESSDGVVPYWSSHMPGVESEKIVASGHGANEHPDGVAEMRRILLENLRTTGRAGR